MSQRRPTETRSRTLLRYLSDAIHDTRLDIGTFTLSLVEQYNGLVPDHQRDFRFQDTGQLHRDLAADTKKVQRFITGTVRIPSDLEEAWVAALPEPFESRLRVELAHRYGHLGVSLDDPTSRASSMAAPAHLMREAGECCTLLADMLADGELNGNDAPLKHTAISKLRQVRAIAVAVEHAIERDVPDAEGVA